MPDHDLAILDTLRFLLGSVDEQEKQLKMSPDTKHDIENAGPTAPTQIADREQTRGRNVAVPIVTGNLHG